MYVIHRLILWTVPIFWLIGLLIVKDNYTRWWQVVIFYFLFLIAVNWFACKKKIDKGFWHFVILPMVFAASSFVFSLFIADNTIFYVSTVITGFLLYYLIRQYYLYFYFPLKYQPYSLESLAWYIVLFTVFFLFANLFSSYILLRFSLIFLMAVGFLALFLTVYYYFWINKINWRNSRLFVLILTLICLQLFLAISYLPTGFYVNSFIVVLALYMMLGLSKLFINGSLNKKGVVIHVLVGVIALIVVVSTARWD